MNAVYPSECPVEFDELTANREGEVRFKSTHVTWTDNVFKNFKGLQRNIKFLGTLFVSSEDGGSPEASFIIRGIPAKVRRSQTGMFYGLMFHYSSTKNSAATQTLDSSMDVNFAELPASNRLPYRW